MDLKDAYRHVVVASRDAHLLGFSLDGREYVDCALDFGGRSSPYIFNMFSEALHSILASWGVRLQQFLDDFLSTYRPGDGVAVLRFTSTLCGYLGMEVSRSKCGTGRCLEVLGVLVDGPTASAWLAERKLHMRFAISSAIEDRRMTVKFAQSLVGCLQDACRVCPLGRAFTSGFYPLLGDSRHSGGHRSVTNSRSLVDDLRWWRNTMKGWPGIRPSGSS